MESLKSQWLFTRWLSIFLIAYVKIRIRLSRCNEQSSVVYVCSISWRQIKPTSSHDSVWKSINDNSLKQTLKYTVFILNLSYHWLTLTSLNTILKRQNLLPMLHQIATVILSHITFIIKPQEKENGKHCENKIGLDLFFKMDS